MSEFEETEAKAALEAFASGAPEVTYKNVTEVAAACATLREKAQDLYNETCAFQGAVTRFIHLQNPTEEVLAGILKNVRFVGDIAGEVIGICERQQKPPSLQTLLETLLSVRLFVRGVQTGEASLAAHGCLFIPTGKAIPSPPGNNQPEDRKRFFSWLREEGLSALIKEDVSWKGFAAEMTRRLEKFIPGSPPPWPDWLRVYVAPSITIRKR